MILIAIPYHEEKAYAKDHLFEWYTSQHKYLPIIITDTGKYGRVGAVKEQLEKLRLEAVKRDADAMVIVEADTIPPADAIDRLAAHNKDVVSALYRYRSEDAPVVAWPKESITEGLCEVEGCGTGCLYLSRNAFTSFSFNDWEQPDADWPMCQELRSKGFKIYLDTNVVCKHYMNEKEYK